MLRKFFTIYLLESIFLSYGYCASIERSNVDTCESDLSPNIIKEIDSYAPIVSKIINATINGDFKGKTWQELADFTDEFGPRLSGTKELEDAIDYVLERSKQFGLENVHGEDVQVPHWVR